jgi:hypothetical protein
MLGDTAVVILHTGLSSDTVVARVIRKDDHILFTLGPNHLLWSADAVRSRLLLGIHMGTTSPFTMRIQEYTVGGALLGQYSGPDTTLDGPCAVSADGSELAFIRYDYASATSKLIVRSTASYSSLEQTIWNLGPMPEVLAISWIGSQQIVTNFIPDGETTHTHM